MSSRKSRASRISHKDEPELQTANVKPSPMLTIMTAVIVIVYNLLILGYLFTLEGQQCKCIKDWRHDFLKYFSIMMIIYSIILIVLSGTNFQNNMIVSGLQTILMLLSFVNIWCLFTYVGDLDSTKCACAIEDQRNMHYFLYIWRYVLVGMIVLGLIMIIIGALSSK